MWMRMVRTPGLAPSKLDPIIDRYRREDLPHVVESDGFLGIALGENRTGGSIGSVTFWADEQAMLATDHYSAEARERLKDAGDAAKAVLVDHFQTTFTSFAHEPAGSARPHMRLVRFTGLAPDMIDLAADSYREDAEHHMRETKGVEGVAVGANHAAGSVAVFSFWSSEYDLREAERLSAQVRERASLAAQLKVTPLVDSFRITIADSLDRVAGADVGSAPAR